jgi:glyoxylase-like metal-dependent hydrolase (beta-lactamase superfamily II)
MNRRELEFSASGLMGPQYPPEYVKHHIDRLHRAGALRLLDLELSGPDEILPEIVCEVAGGHTEGSMNILVETREGTACICGDIVYDVQNSLVEPYHVMLEREPQVTGNHGLAKATGESCDQEGAELGALPAHEARLSRSHRGGTRRGAPRGLGARA